MKPLQRNGNNPFAGLSAMVESATSTEPEQNAYQQRPARRTSKDHQKLTVYLPEPQYRELKIASLEQHRELYLIAEEAFREWLERRTRTKAKAGKGGA